MGKGVILAQSPLSIAQSLAADGRTYLTSTLYAICCMLCVVCCMLYVVCCILYVICCMFYAVVCCILYVICCILYVVCMLVHRITLGDGNYGYAGDGGAATSATLASPYGIAVDTMGNLYIADRVNQRVRTVTQSGVLFTRRVNVLTSSKVFINISASYFQSFAIFTSTPFYKYYWNMSDA